MDRIVSFPGLGLEFSLQREVFPNSPIPVYWYGIIVVTGIALGLFYTLKRSRSFGIHPDRMMDVVLYSVMAGLVGARIYYVAFTWDYYKAHPGEIIAIWKGGIAIYGGLIAAFALGIYLCRRWKIPPLRATDCAVGGLLLGQSIGRWGNFVNMEAFGANTTLPWGMTGTDIVAYLTRMQGDLAAMGIAVDPNLPVHPTFLYESLWNLIGFLFLVWYTRRRHFHGELTLLYCGWYGLGRAWIEGLRTDSLMMGSFRVSQIVAILGVIISACLWLRLNHCVRAGNAPAWAMRGSDEALQAEAEAMVLPACKQASTPVATSEEISSSQDAIDPPENEDPDHPDKPNTTQQ